MRCHVWTASIKEDLPQPFGPTSNTSRAVRGISVIVVSVNRLKFVSRISRIFIRLLRHPVESPTITFRIRTRMQGAEVVHDLLGDVYSITNWDGQSTRVR